VFATSSRDEKEGEEEKPSPESDVGKTGGKSAIPGQQRQVLI
jgi:hypothetical protein